MATKDTRSLPTGVCSHCRRPLDDHQWFIVARDGGGWPRMILKEYDQPQCPGR